MNPKIHAGQLREKVSVMSYTVGKDSIGTPVANYCILGYIQAKVEYTTAKESSLVTKEVGLTRVIFTIRKRDDLDKKMILALNGYAYNIISILKISEPRNQYLEIVTEYSYSYNNSLNQILAPDGQWLASPDGEWLMAP